MLTKRIPLLFSREDLLPSLEIDTTKPSYQSFGNSYLSQTDSGVLLTPMLPLGHHDWRRVESDCVAQFSYAFKKT